MISRAVRIRLIAFLVLSAVGIVYITASYLGFIDKLLGRQLEISVTLPASSGLFEGSEVTQRGVKIGKIEQMDVIPEGVRLDLTLEQGTELPLKSPVYVHNLSAVGEQYLDFEPTSSDGPYAEEGDVIRGGPESLPVDEDDLLVQLDELVGSVDKQQLRTVIAETGAMFDDTGRPLQRLIDSGDAFIREAQANQTETIRLLDSGLVVLRAQQAQGDNIRSFARDLADVTDTVRQADGDLRTVLDDTPAAARELDAMLRQIEPTVPIMLANLVSVQQVVTDRLSAVEQLLVTFPRMIASGFTGTPGDGFGHINMQLGADAPAPCRKGYLPPNQWRPGSDLTDDPTPFLEARCESGPPYNMRGSKYAPSFPPVRGAGRAAPGGSTGSGTVGAAGGPVSIGSVGGERSLFGDDSWKWMLVGPLTDPAAGR